MDATMTTLYNTISNLQRDTSGTIANVANECMECFRIIVQESEHTTYFVTNGFYAMITAIVLSIFLSLAQTPPLIRAVIWMMYTSLCLHMLMNYFRQCRSRTAEIQYRNLQLVQMIARSKNSSEIVLTGNKLNDEDIRIVINRAINNQQCTNLKLVDCQITPTGAKILADVLFNNKTLIRLSLSNNQLGDKGVQSLSNALSANDNSLKKLDLSQNDITDEGVDYLAQMLKTNTILTHLSLSNNRITDQGVQLLNDALQNRNKTLQVLSLTQNKLLTDACLHFIINIFQHNQSLKKLSINDCNLSKKGKDRLKRATHKGFELTA
jgi:Ran GTPase-activating protein (RanGAP) involved in mRNA processing and transport